MTVQEIEDASLPTTKRLEWHENPFKIELAHFGDFIREGRVPLTSGDEVVQHVALVRDIVRAYLSRGACHGA